MAPGIVFLMYHELELAGRTLAQSEPGYVRYILPEPAFRSQIDWLRNNGYHFVGVDDVRAAMFVAGQVELAHAFLRHGAQEGAGIELVIEGADKDVVHVEQDLAIRALGELGDEFPFRELGGGVGDVA